MLKILIYLFIPLLCYAQEPFQLKNVLQRGQIGDFVVASHQKNYTLWHIKDRTDTSILLEEISVPKIRVKGMDQGWQSWVDSNAPQHIGWVAYTIDLLSGRILGLYSFDQGCWLSQDIPNRFLATLLNVPFYSVGDQERRRMGKGSLASSPYWNPPHFYHGSEILGQRFDQYITRWPADGTELSNKKVEIYLLQSLQYPSFFPYWLQVSGSFGKISIRIVDSGSRLYTPTQAMWKLSTPMN
jgi:hypothetical protein